MTGGQATAVNIQLEEVAVIRGGRIVLQKLSFSAQAGHIIWLRGANGSGKSTILRLLSGLLPAASGRCTVTGKIGLADERLSLDLGLTLEKAIEFWAKMDGADVAEQQDALNAFDLAGLAEFPMSYLSTGQRKRSALARILTSNANIWLLNEPYNGLDSANAARLDARLTKHAQNGGIAVVAAHQPAAINVTATISLDEQAARKAA